MGKEEFLNRIVMDCNDPSASPREMDVLVSVDDKTYTCVTHYSRKKVESRFCLQITPTRARYIKFVLTNTQEQIPEVWYVADISCYYTSDVGKTTFYRLDNGRKEPINRICSGIVQLERVIASETPITGRMYAAIYQSETNQLMEVVCSDVLSFYEGFQTYTLSLKLD